MLVVGVVVIFGMIVFRVMGALQGPGAPAASGNDKIGAAGPQEALPGAAPSKSDAPDADIVVSKFAPGATPNPFHRIFDERTGLPDIVSADNKHRKGGNNGTSNGGRQPDTAPPPPPAVVEADPMEVKGIMGDVAVIQVGDKQYVVDSGSPFGYGMRLKSVTPTEVVVQIGKTTQKLKVGVRTVAPNPVSKPSSSGSKGLLPGLKGAIGGKDSPILVP